MNPIRLMQFYNDQDACIGETSISEPWELTGATMGPVLLSAILDKKDLFERSHHIKAFGITLTRDSIEWSRSIQEFCQSLQGTIDEHNARYEATEGSKIL